MMRLQRILRDHQDAGSVNSLIALCGFVDRDVFLTKAGHVGIVFRLAGVDYECLDESSRRDVVHRFEAALRVLDEQCRVYQYLCKRRVPPIDVASCEQPIVNDAVQRRAAYLNERRSELYELDLHLVLVYEGLRSGSDASTRLQGVLQHPRRALREWLSSASVLRLLEADLDRAVAQLQRASYGCSDRTAQSQAS